MARRDNTFEGGVDGTVITSGNSGGASGDAFNVVVTNTPATEPAFDNTHAIGTLSAHVAQTAAAADFCQVRWTALGDLAEAYGQICIYITAAPPNTVSVCHSQTTAGGQLGRVRLLTSRLFAIANSAGTIVATSTTPATTNDFTRVEWRWQQSPNQFTIRIGLDVNSSSYIEELIGAMNDTTAYGRQEYGMSQTIGSGSYDYWMDSLVAGATTWPSSVNVQDSDDPPIGFSGRGAGW